jgi:TPR repeat protein
LAVLHRWSSGLLVAGAVSLSPLAVPGAWAKHANDYWQAAQAGDPRAQNELGYCYEHGLGVAKDPQDAVKWYRKAAEAGNSAGQNNLGYCYEHGLGVAKDPEEAVLWYRKAAEAGNAAGQYNLGHCYHHGIGVAKDPEEAVLWYRKTAEAGDADGQNNLGHCYQDGIGVAKDPEEAAKWYRLAAEAGNSYGQNNLGYCYQNGIGVAKDPEEAVKWYRMAAEAENAYGQNNLGHCYENGNGVARDLTEAAAWFQKAATAGHPRAQENLRRVQQAPPSQPPRLACTVTFQEPSGNNALDAEEDASIRLHLTNRGKGPAQAVKATVTGAVRGLLVPGTLEVGDLAPGATQEVTLPLRSTRALAEGRAALTIAIADRHGFDAPLVVQHLETRAFQAPAFAVELGVDDGSGNGLVERGEELTLKVVVRNQGGAARGVQVALDGPDDITWLGGRQPVRLGDIPPGGWSQATFGCLVRNQYAGPEALPLRAVVSEARADLGGAYPVALTLNQAGPRIVELVAQARAEARADAPAPALSDPVDQAPARQRTQPEAHAVIIGIERYKNALVPPVSHARRDATIVREYMTRTLGIPPENVHLLVDHEASLADLRTAISGQLANALDDPKARVYVYFAGHGAPNLKTKQPYLVPHDGNPAYPETSCYPLSELYESLGKLGVPVTVMLDACFSGSAGRGDAPETLLANARPALVELKDTGAPSNVSVLAAANGDQVSSSFAAKRHGLFTYFLLKGLGGEADADRDDRLTLDELHRYVTPAVQRQARKLNREQTPTLQGSGEVAVY